MADTFDRNRTFEDLIDSETVHEIAGLFRNVFSVGITVMDTQRQDAVSLNAEDQKTGKICNQGLKEIRQHQQFPDFEWQEGFFSFKASSGFDFELFAIDHECETVGIAVIGPFAEDAAANLSQADKNQHLSRDASFIKHFGKLFAAILKHIIKANFKTAVVSELHAETVDLSYADLLEKNIMLEKSEMKYRDLAENLEHEVAKRTEELKEAQLRLYQSDKLASVGQLAAGVAHEINNPVGFVHSNMGSLKRYLNNVLELFSVYEDTFTKLKSFGSKDIDAACSPIDTLKQKLKIDFIVDDIQSIISESLDGTARVKKIVADLKSFSHVDQEQFKHADVNQGIDITLNIIWNELKYKCRIEKDYGELPPLYCNPGQLNQVFMNILVNASHAIEQQGTIHISTRFMEKSSISKTGHIEIRIADTGSGITEDIIGKIFEPFFTTKEVGKGTGMGLSISYDIIKKHGGELQVDSTVSAGTTFTIVLPVKEKDECSEE